MNKINQLITISNNLNEAVINRYKKYFRFNNTNYWKEYYLPKIKDNDISRERLYSQIIKKNCGINAKVADIGSGYGFLAREMVNQELDVTCVDLFEEMLVEAKKRLQDKKADFVKADILDLPFKENSLDCIVLESLIEHFPLQEVQEDILPYLHKFIRHNGFLFIHVPIKSFHSVVARWIRKFYLNDLPRWAIDDDGDVTHKMWLNYKSYIKLIEKHGFSIVNYDFRMTRSNARPKLLFNFMKEIQKKLSDSDEELCRSIEEESTIIKIKKMIKSHFGLTSYLLFKRIK
ncbi:class I SAM-dependent methyltransferase [Candidatus Woesebacteria bacterium]|nr:class I SAM-dependent methyltransferase [Candidatus Woesebacteria bacterium]